VTNLASGKYRAWVATPSFEAAPPSRNFQIIAPRLEKTLVLMEEADMRLAAKKSGGEYIPFAETRGLESKLPRGRQVRIESQPPAPVWNSPSLAGLFVLLIVSEWVLRKRSGLL